MGAVENVLTWQTPPEFVNETVKHSSSSCRVLSANARSGSVLPVTQSLPTPVLR
jgi:hypothetical protein